MPWSRTRAKVFHPDAVYIILAIGTAPPQVREQLRNPEGRAALIRQFGDPQHLKPRMRAYRIAAQIAERFRRPSVWTQRLLLSVLIAGMIYLDIYYLYRVLIPGLTSNG